MIAQQNADRINIPFASRNGFMELNRAARLAHSLMSKHGLLPHWKFEFDRAIQRFGQCNWRKKKISLSAKLVLLNDEAEVRDTILHEIAHALAPAGSNHGPKWKKIAQAIGCTGQRCYDHEVAAPPAKFTGTCPTCRRTIYRHRRSRVSCAHCDRRFNPKHVFVWTRKSSA
jgi:predicted SprT family Zn-dependent metalloprotease